MSIPESKIKNYIIGTCSLYFYILPIGLPHISFLIGFILFLIHCRNKIYLSSTIWIGLFLIFGLIYFYLGSSWKALVNNVSSMMMFPIIYELCLKDKKCKIIEYSKTFIQWTLVGFIIEASIRFVVSTTQSPESGIYRYKFGSICFFDTNFLGLALLGIIFFIKYLTIFEKIKLSRYYIISIILLFFTISRAAILAWIIGEFVFYNISIFKYRNIILKRIFMIFILGIIVGTPIFLFLKEDPSFRTKLHILELANDFFTNSKINMFWGVGYEHSERMLGIYPHNSVFLFFIETGYLGLTLKILFIGFILLKSNFKILIVLLPYFVATMSATGYGSHYLYVIMAIITILANKSKAINEYSICNQ